LIPLETTDWPKIQQKRNPALFNIYKARGFGRVEVSIEKRGAEMQNKRLERRPLKW